MQKAQIDIALAFDKNFITPFLVTITSVFENNKGVFFNIHTIATGVSAAEKERITKFVEQNNASISFYEFDPKQVKDLAIPKDSYLSLAAYYRMFFPFLVPAKVKKLLYIDCDIIVVGSLLDLYNTNLGKFPLAAVTEVNATTNRPELGIYEEGIYFNSGVMVMNVPEWKKQKITERGLQFVADNPEKIIYLDQDALNVSAMKNYYSLDARFNVLPFDIPEYSSKQQYKEFLKDKVIIHYTLKQYKPWSCLSIHPYNYLYKYYFKKSPQAAQKMYTDFEASPRFLLRMLKSRMRPLIRKLPVSVRRALKQY